MDSGVRGTQHASGRGTPWGVKPVDNGPTSASHTAVERAPPATYADGKEPAQASLKKTGASDCYTWPKMGKRGPGGVFPPAWAVPDPLGVEQAATGC